MSCITLERGSHRWPLHPLQDAPALPPPSETATRSLASAPRTNATVSVLLGQNWKALPATERAVYVEAAKKIKEDFKAEHPECVLLAPSPHPPPPALLPRTPRHATAREAPHTGHAAHTAWCTAARGRASRASRARVALTGTATPARPGPRGRSARGGTPTRSKR